jgi:hypothetical protein
MTRFVAPFVLLAAIGTSPSIAGELGQHPAVVIKGISHQAAFDYASKFYLHPATMFLAASQPMLETSTTMVAAVTESQMAEHPAVLVKREEIIMQKERIIAQAPADPLSD